MGCWETVEGGVPIHNDWHGYEPHPCDVILMVKLYASSTHACDCLKVFLPNAELAKLPPQPTELASRNALSSKQINEFSKTAAFIRKAPWHLDNAADYIDRLVHNNQWEVNTE